MSIYFDHNCGGGTEVYFYNKLKQLTPEQTILRIQEFNNQYKLSIFSHNNSFEIFYSWENLKKILSQINNSTIIINNLVGYEKRFEILKFVNFLKKQKADSNNKIKALGHDYFSICPSWNLINEKKQYCKLPNKNDCEKCFNINKNIKKKWEISKAGEILGATFIMIQ
jgi:hypothetical protein